MKKTFITIIAVVLIIAATMITLTACTDNTATGGSSSSDSRIQLTKSNADNYLNVRANCSGTGFSFWDSSFKTYWYAGVVTGVSLSSASSMIKFYDCELEVRVDVQFNCNAHQGINTVTNTFKIKLDFGGSGSASATDSLNKECHCSGISTHKTYYGRNLRVINCSLVSISGYIEIN